MDPLDMRAGSETILAKVVQVFGAAQPHHATALPTAGPAASRCCGYHRKHGIRVLGAEADPGLSRPARNQLYDEAVRQALIVLWETGDRVCGKRLKALIPVLISAMERHGHLDLHAEIKARLLQISAATIDRTLGDARSRFDGQRT